MNYKLIYYKNTKGEEKVIVDKERLFKIVNILSNAKRKPAICGGNETITILMSDNTRLEVHRNKTCISLDIGTFVISKNKSIQLNNLLK